MKKAFNARTPLSKVSVLYVVTELGGLMKFGGIGDVAAAMGKGMQAHTDDIDFRFLLPGAPVFHENTTATGKILTLSYKDSGPLTLKEVFTPEGAIGYLVDDPCFREITGPIYNARNGFNSPDGNHLCGIMENASCAIAKYGADGFKPEIVHLNDYPFTNITPEINAIAVEEGRRIDVLGNLHLLKGAHAGDPKVATLFNHASLLVAVSPTFAEEIQRRPNGAGFEYILEARAGQGRLFGIMNGVDPYIWGPNFDETNLVLAKAMNKSRLQQELGLEVNGNKPLVSAIHRIDPEHKGLDMFMESIPSMVAQGAQVIVHGQGDPHNPDSQKAVVELNHLQESFPEQVRFLSQYKDKTAKTILGASDIHCSPSRGEPGGMSNWNAMLNYVVPVVTSVGGLKDAVEDGQTGYVAKAVNTPDLLDVLNKAITVCRENPDQHVEMAVRAMNSVQTFQTMTDQYVDLYKVACQRQSPAVWMREQLPDYQWAFTPA